VIRFVRRIGDDRIWHKADIEDSTVNVCCRVPSRRLFLKPPRKQLLVRSHSSAKEKTSGRPTAGITPTMGYLVELDGEAADEESFDPGGFPPART
jgi:hypothetical protein